MATYALPDDVRELWIGSGTLPYDTVIQAWLDKAEMLIFSEIVDLEDRLAEDVTGEVANKVKFVATQMVIRVFKNPDGARQRSQTAGVFTSAITFGSETIRQPLVIEPEERAMLAGRSSAPARAFGVDMIDTPAPISPLLGAWVNGPDGTAPGETP